MFIQAMNDIINLWKNSNKFKVLKISLVHTNSGFLIKINKIKCTGISFEKILKKWAGLKFKNLSKYVKSPWESAH